MEKIVGVGCRFRLALFLRLKLYTFWKKWETRVLGALATKTQPTKSKNKIWL